MSAGAVERFEAGLAEVEAAYRDAFAAAKGEQALRAVNARFVGPQGQLTVLLKLIPELPKESRRDFGRRANELKKQVEGAFELSLLQQVELERNAELVAAPIDVTLPGRGRRPGRLHPITRVKHELLDIFASIGFDVATGPEIDLHEHNFDKLGFPPDHPATDMQDSFFVRGPDGEADRRALLRTHTSTVQVREMLRRKPPLAVVSPGAVYRRDDDATHSPMFCQIEGLLVDRDVSFADLKGVLSLFAGRLFGAGTPVRVRPSYFPFVEPGGEVDIGCVFCRHWTEGGAARAAACRLCKGTGFLEILGCGMVHPVVFENVGYDPREVTGFAFGMGIDRIAMLRYGIPNIRLLYDNDVRFLGQL